jgi:hypothetical protein
MKIYHHNDLDGRCAGAIAYQYHRDLNINIDIIELDYKDTINDNAIGDQEIAIIDFCLPRLSIFPIIEFFPMEFEMHHWRVVNWHGVAVTRSRPKGERER